MPRRASTTLRRSPAPGPARRAKGRPEPASGTSPAGRAADAARIGIVVSAYNRTVTDALLAGAIEASALRGIAITPDDVLRTAGAWELVIGARGLLHRGRAGRTAFDALVVLGCIIKGQTSHDQHLAHAVMSGLMRVQLDSGVPIGLGVLTVDTPQQAIDRAGGSHGNKGAEAAEAVIDLLRATRSAGGTAVATRGRDVPDKVAPGRRP